MSYVSLFSVIVWVCVPFMLFSIFPVMCVSFFYPSSLLTDYLSLEWAHESTGSSTPPSKQKSYFLAFHSGAHPIKHAELNVI